MIQLKLSAANILVYIKEKFRGTKTMDFLANIDTTGIQNLILAFFKFLSEFDLKSLDFDYLGTVLTVIAPIWNPIWAGVSEWLYEVFGF